MTQENIEAQKGLNYLGNKYLWIFAGALAIIYFIFSTFSNGFYMHDEPAFYLYARNFWGDPVKALTGFGKLGYVLFLALPSIGGYAFLHIFNSVLASLTVTYSYKIVKKIGGQNSFLIFLILGLQPLWFMLSFRNYSEFLVAFLLVMSIWNHFNKKYMFTALLLSYVALARQEYNLFLAVYFIMMIAKKQYIAAVLTSTFTIIHNFTGFAITGDILYLPNKVLGFSELTKGAYPKRGFQHYFVMANVVFGSVAIVLFWTYFAAKVLTKKMPNWILVTPILFVFLLNCLINMESFDLGPSNAGNLRYMIPIIPLVSIIAVLGIDELKGLTKKQNLLIFLIPLTILIAIYHTFDHDFMKLIEDGDRVWLPLGLALATVAILILPIKQKHYTISFAVLTVVLAVSSVRTFDINPEDATMKKAGKWYLSYLKKNKNNPAALFTEESRIACSHILFFYFSDKYGADFVNKPIIDFTKENTDTLKSGDLVVWDSHYGYRPKLRPTSQSFDFYDKNPEFEKIQYYQSKDRRFLVAFFRKK